MRTKQKNTDYGAISRRSIKMILKKGTKVPEGRNARKSKICPK